MAGQFHVLYPLETTLFEFILGTLLEFTYHPNSAKSTDMDTLI